MAAPRPFVCLCGKEIGSGRGDAASVEADNAAIGAHVFGRTFLRVRVRPCAAAAARKTWELVVGPASGAPPCPVFAGITLPAHAHVLELQHGVGRREDLAVTRWHRKGPDPGARTLESACFLCHGRFRVTVRRSDKSSMAKRARIARPVCNRCAIWVSARNNNQYAACSAGKRARRFTAASLRDYTPLRPSYCLDLRADAMRAEFAAANRALVEEQQRRRRRRPAGSRGSRPTQRIAQLLVDAVTTCVWTEVVAARAGTAAYRRPPPPDGGAGAEALYTDTGGPLSVAAQ